ncbi:MAG: glycosyltransferase family 9 protein [Chitinophagales bacterium]|nr:glycosyltransferase family 9 protein [Chitinophagales bacterium]
MNILIIRLSSIGDIILTSPIVRCIKKQMRDAKIDYITKKEYTKLLSANPNINTVYTLDNDIKIINKNKYDYIIDLHDNIRSRKICSQLDGKVLRYNKQRFKRWLLTTFKIDLLRNHIVDRYFSAVKSLNIINDGQGLDYFIPSEDEISAGQLPFTHITGYCVIVVGTKHFTKTIPKAHLEYICKHIKIPIILIGGKEDAYLGTQLSIIDDFKIYNACGKYNLNQSAAIIKKAKFVITGDTGMMHIAAAFQKRTIAIFGSTDSRLGFSPYQSASNYSIVENTNLKCRPCHKHGKSTCPKKHFKCMLAINPQKIIDVI